MKCEFQMNENGVICGQNALSSEYETVVIELWVVFCNFWINIINDVDGLWLGICVQIDIEKIFFVSKLRFILWMQQGT